MSRKARVRLGDLGHRQEERRCEHAGAPPRFLSDPTHRIRFVYLPQHSSWLNQIEIIFGIINYRVMRCGSFNSNLDLIEKLKRFIKYFHEAIANPMNWNYTGRPTRNTATPRARTWRELGTVAMPWQKLALMGMNL